MAERFKNGRPFFSVNCSKGWEQFSTGEKNRKNRFLEWDDQSENEKGAQKQM